MEKQTKKSTTVSFRPPKNGSLMPLFPAGLVCAFVLATLLSSYHSPFDVDQPIGGGVMAAIPLQSASISTTGRPSQQRPPGQAKNDKQGGQPGGVSNDDGSGGQGEKKPCKPYAKCYTHADCGSSDEEAAKGGYFAKRCNGLFDRCNCAACSARIGFPCTSEQDCGGLRYSCPKGHCDCVYAANKLYNETDLKIRPKTSALSITQACNQIKCSSGKDACFGLPCTSGFCTCPIGG